MNKNKKLMQGIILMITTLAIACSAAFTGAEVTQTPADANIVAKNGKAGIVASLEQTENRMLDEVQLADVTVEKTETQIVTVASKSEAQEAVAKKAEENKEPEMTKTEKEWQDKVMADVEDFLCIREKGDADAAILGKLYPTSVATVVKEGKTWTKIKSGSVKGYVKNEYLLFGSEAYENAKKVCKKYAYVQTDGLRVRSEADEDAKVLAVADKGDKLEYNKKAEKADGWVAVTVSAGNGYVSADYVKVKLGTTEAVSIEEELKAQKEKEAKAAKANASSVATKNAPTSASVDDATLLAAIIQCEAGSEPYEGKVAVGAVVLNRMRSGRWPNSISGVIYQRGQFGPVSNGSLARALSGSISSSCKNAAAEALAGSDPTGGRMFFHRANGRDGLIIGNHVFY
ncbi:MAG: cell wall hydrolase [bacterium]|nr:cell wall hydrolase [bacterium]MDY4101250.1 cell wall hydrolase [Lachnospiraceae bacterium]